MPISPKPKTVLELFEGHPERWCKGSYARNSHNRRTIIKKGFKFCIRGACYFIYADGELVSIEHIRAIQKLNEAKIPPSWNDSPERTFEDIVNKCRELNI